MNIKLTSLASLAGIAGMMLLAGNARGVTAVAGDLILSFRASGGLGSDTNLEVNIGPASNYYGAAPGTSFVVTSLSVLDIAATYGPTDWASRTDLFWGIAGTTGAAAVGIAPARTIWASRAEAAPGTMSTPWVRNVLFTLQTPSNTISTMYTGAPGSIGNYSATANSASSSLVPSNEPGSWTVQEDFTPGVSFRYFNPSVLGSAGNFPATPSAYDGVNGYSVLDLFEVRPGTAGTQGTLVGAFGLNSLGQVVFSTDPGVFAAIPEPTTAMAVSGALLALILRRRR